MRTKAMPAEERFWSYVPDRPPDECWLWTGNVDAYGYGRGTFDGKRQFAHRFAFELAGGTLTPGLVIDHLCRNRLCVNPAHLELVTRTENNRRGLSPSGVNLAKTHCVRGHEFTPQNTRLVASGNRQCRACESLYPSVRSGRKHRRAKEAVSAVPPLSERPPWGPDHPSYDEMGQ